MRINLTGGAYQMASVIAAAQRCVNLFPEINPAQSGETAKATHYPTAGMVTRVVLPAAPLRGMFTASNGDLYAVGGAGVYHVASNYAVTQVGTLTTSAGLVSMADNTLTLVVVDGSKRGNDPASLAGGMQVDLATLAAAPMPTEDEGFYGADRVEYVSTFLVFNKPGSPQFYVSDSLATTFDPLYFANKSGATDYLTAAVATHGQMLLIGQRTSEVWTLSGASDFPFQQLQGTLIEHGTYAPGTIAKIDGQVFFLSSDAQGRNIVMKISGYQASRVSNHAIETQIAASDNSNTAAFCYQYRGHSFYVLSIAAATWVFDLATEQWHQWMSLGSLGNEERHRAICFAYAYGTSLVGDRVTGSIYELRSDAGTEDGRPIQRIRSFPHMIHDGKRISYHRLLADMDVAPDSPANVTLRYSDDRGRSYGNPVRQTLGTNAATNTSVQFRRLGQARDRVFELSWDSPSLLALNGAFIEVDEAGS